MSTPQREEELWDSTGHKLTPEEVKVIHRMQREEGHKEEWRKTLEAIGYANINEGVIEAILQSKAEELLREVEGMRKKLSPDTIDILGFAAPTALRETEVYNIALTDIEHLIRTVLEKK
jgi:hypothetical protein